MMETELSFHGGTSCKIVWPTSSSSADAISVVPLFRTRLTIDNSINPLRCRVRYFVEDAVVSGEWGLVLGLEDGRILASERVSFGKNGGGGWENRTFSAYFPPYSSVSMVGLWGTRGSCAAIGEMEITQMNNVPLHKLMKGCVKGQETECGVELSWDDLEEVDRWEVFLNDDYLGVSYVSRYMLNTPRKLSSIQIYGFSKSGQKIYTLQ